MLSHPSSPLMRIYEPPLCKSPLPRAVAVWAVLVVGLCITWELTRTPSFALSINRCAPGLAAALGLPPYAALAAIIPRAVALLADGRSRAVPDKGDFSR